MINTSQLLQCSFAPSERNFRTDGHLHDHGLNADPGFVANPADIGLRWMKSLAGDFHHQSERDLLDIVSVIDAGSSDSKVENRRSTAAAIFLSSSTEDGIGAGLGDLVLMLPVDG